MLRPRIGFRLAATSSIESHRSTGGNMKSEISEPCRVNPEDEIRIGRSSWDDQDVSIKYTWFDKRGQPSRGGEVPVAVLPQMFEFAIRAGYLMIGAE
jgi:hypothetical protein